MVETLSCKQLEELTKNLEELEKIKTDGKNKSLNQEIAYPMLLGELFTAAIYKNAQDRILKDAAENSKTQSD